MRLVKGNGNAAALVNIYGHRKGIAPTPNELGFLLEILGIFFLVGVFPSLHAVHCVGSCLSAALPVHKEHNVGPICGEATNVKLYNMTQ